MKEQGFIITSEGKVMPQPRVEQSEQGFNLANILPEMDYGLKDAALLAAAETTALLVVLVGLRLAQRVKSLRRRDYL